MFSYTAYGLGIHSFVPLPELIAEEQKADVVFRLGRVNGSSLHTVDEMHRFKADSNEAHYFMDGVGSFLARGGQEIIVDPRPDADERVVRLCLLGPALALILHQRQRLVLHAPALSQPVTGRLCFWVGRVGGNRPWLRRSISEGIKC